MSKFIATSKCVLAFNNTAATGNIVIVNMTSPCTSDGNGIFYDKIQFTVSNYTIGGFSQTSPVQGSIIGTSQFATIKKKPVVLEGDTSATLIIPGQEGDSTTTKTDTVYVKDAGQNVIKAT